MKLGEAESTIYSEKSCLPWLDVREQLKEVSEGSVNFTYTLKPLDMDEDYPFEYDGLRLGLRIRRKLALQEMLSGMRTLYILV